jgi:hypothetical protein
MHRNAKAFVYNSVLQVHSGHGPLIQINIVYKHKTGKRRRTYMVAGIQAQARRMSSEFTHNSKSYVKSYFPVYPSLLFLSATYNPGPETFEAHKEFSYVQLNQYRSVGTQF